MEALDSTPGSVTQVRETASFYPPGEKHDIVIVPGRSPRKAVSPAQGAGAWTIAAMLDVQRVFAAPCVVIKIDLAQ